MLGPVDAYAESSWEAVHNGCLAYDITHNQDLMAAIAREDAAGLAKRRAKLKAAQKKRRPRAHKNEIGRRYGLLRVVAKSTEKVWYGGALWVCICDCGATRTVRGVALRSGDVRSCSRLRHPRGVEGR